MLMSQADRVRAFARLLGWPRAREERHRIEHAGAARIGGAELIWYESAITPEVYLQVTTLGGMKAAVIAVRYRLHTGFHDISLPASLGGICGEAARLGGLLAAVWFQEPKGRSAFRRLHPECTGWTWKRLRAGELPKMEGKGVRTP